MATRGTIAGPIAILLALSLAAGCTLWTPEGTPAPAPPPATVTVVPATTASPAPTFTGAGGAGESPGPTAPTMTATPASPTVTPGATGTAVATVVTDSGGDVATPGTTLVATAPVPAGTATIAELAAADPELSRFVQALRQGGVYETLNGTGTYTVFAPNNAAFDAVPSGTLTRLLLDRTALDRVANHHVVYGRWLASDLARAPQVETRSGDALTVTLLPGGELQVDGARVVRADLAATNGVVHVIDRVMIPPGAL